MSIGRQMDKKVVVCIHNGVLLSFKKNAFESVLMKWMKLEPIIQREESQKEKHQHSTLDSILESRDITLPTKVHLVKAMVFPVVIYGCESWTVKKAEC